LFVFYILYTTVYLFCLHVMSVYPFPSINNIFISSYDLAGKQITISDKMFFFHVDYL